MSERYNPVARAIEVVMQIEKTWRVLPKRTYRVAREAVAEALRAAYGKGFTAGVESTLPGPSRGPGQAENGGVK